MKFIKAVVTLVVAASCAGCASYGGAPSLSTSTGRYLQIKHPVSGVVGFQMTFQSPEACAGMLSTSQWKPDSKEMQPFMACVGTPASPALPARATVRNKTYAFLVDIEAVSLTECKAFVDGLMNSEGKENLEVVAPCAQR